MSIRKIKDASEKLTEGSITGREWKETVILAISELGGRDLRDVAVILAGELLPDEDN